MNPYALEMRGEKRGRVEEACVMVADYTYIPNPRRCGEGKETSNWHIPDDQEDGYRKTGALILTLDCGGAEEFSANQAYSELTMNNCD